MLEEPTSSIYLPLFYLEKVKKPGESHFVKQILTDELLILILAISWLSPNPILHAICMMVLLLSFYCIYEIGYWENDLIGEKFEKHPVLSEVYHRYQHKVNLLQPWLWAIILAIPGLLLLELSKANINTWDAGTIAEFIASNQKRLLIDLEFWFAFLVFTRFSFFVFNHVNKETRVWIYPILQATKCFGFLCVTVTNTIGTMLFASQVLVISIPYFIYRCGGEGMNFPKYFPKRLGRILIFGLLLAALALGDRSFSIVLNWQVLTIIVVLLMRATNDISQVIRQMKPISHEKVD